MCEKDQQAKTARKGKSERQPRSLGSFSMGAPGPLNQTNEQGGVGKFREAEHRDQ